MKGQEHSRAGLLQAGAGHRAGRPVQATTSAGHRAQGTGQGSQRRAQPALKAQGRAANAGHGSRRGGIDWAPQQDRWRQPMGE